MVIFGYDEIARGGVGIGFIQCILYGSAAALLAVSENKWNFQGNFDTLESDISPISIKFRG